MDRRTAVIVIGLLAAFAVPMTAGNPREAFARSWEGRPVTVRQALYTLVYNERGKLGNTYSGKRDGLTVLTPSSGVYFQFDGRQGQDDIVAPVPQKIMDKVSEAYGPNTLDLRSYRKLEPVAVHQFSVGARLIVGRIRFERDAVKVGFVQPGNDIDSEPVTSLRIKWPMPFSKSFAEADNLDALMRTYVEPNPIS